MGFVIAAAVRLCAPPVICVRPVGHPMRDDGTALASAAMLYLMENEAGRCPTIEELKRELFLERSARTNDVWGTQFRIECEGNQAVVVSAGPDLVFDTEDDFEASKH